MALARVLLASGNAAKQDELRRLLHGLPIAAMTPAEAGAAEPDVEESGGTHRENAATKALAWAKTSGLPALASDGGLHIPALGESWDGLWNRRFAGPGDDDRIAALLALMDGLREHERAATFREAVALALPDERLVLNAEATSPEGRIAESADPRRRPGFWGSSLWLYPPGWVTEFDLSETERLSLDTAWTRLRAVVLPELEAWSASVCAGTGPAW